MSCWQESDLIQHRGAAAALWNSQHVEPFNGITCKKKLRQDFHKQPIRERPDLHAAKKQNQK